MTGGTVSDAVRLAQRDRPRGPLVMRQRWDDLLFLHWAMDPDLVQASLPAGLTVDTFDGRAWMAIVPFSMRKVRPRGLPALPGLSNFGELNLRTYAVDADGIPGVWFYSLDADQWLAVKIARTLFRLPYEHAAITESNSAGTFRFESTRRGEDRPLTYEWTPRGPATNAPPGSLRFFLLERYVLFAPSRQPETFLRGRVHHTPYPVREADMTAADPRLFTLNGLPEPTRPPDDVAASDGVSVDIYPLRSP